MSAAVFINEGLDCSRRTLYHNCIYINQERHIIGTLTYHSFIPSLLLHYVYRNNHLSNTPNCFIEPLYILTF